MNGLDIYRLLIAVPLFTMFLLVGVALLVLPTARILKWDKQTGHWLYTHASTPERGLFAAGVFYRLLGAFVVSVAVFGVLPAVLK